MNGQIEWTMNSDIKLLFFIYISKFIELILFDLTKDPQFE